MITWKSQLPPHVPTLVRSTWQVEMAPDVVNLYKLFTSETWPEADLGSVVTYARGSTRLSIPQEWRECFTLSWAITFWDHMKTLWKKCKTKRRKFPTKSHKFPTKRRKFVGVGFQHNSFWTLRVFPRAWLHLPREKNYVHGWNFAHMSVFPTDCAFCISTISVGTFWNL